MRIILKRKEAKGTKKCVIKGRVKFKDYCDSLFKNKNTLRSQQRFKSDHHTIYTKEVNKTAISSDDDKRLQNLKYFYNY